jgi:acyl transferase domain-containing protein
MSNLRYDSAAAIVGCGLRVPGCGSLAELADALIARRRTYGELAARIDRGYLDPAMQVGAARVASLLGGTIAAPPGEGPALHRLLVAATFEALDAARLARTALRGQPVPVFVAHSRGGAHGLYDVALEAAAARLLPYLVHAAHPHELDEAQLTAVVDQVRGQLREALAPGFVAAPAERAVARLAGVVGEALGTTAEAVVVDGNCTGGLIALELAERAIARGAPYAIAAALSHVDTVNQVLYSNARLLSARGCDPFAQHGDGTVISDGVVAVVLTRAARARRDGLAILGVVRGVAGANDGAVERYMLTPHARGHNLAIARAQDRGGVAATDVGVFLAHGSGTRAGDTVEAQVFSRAVQRGGGRPAAPVPVLSIKGNVGHAKEAAGLANLAALLAMFERERIAGPVHDDAIRDSVATEGVIEVKHTAAAWPAGARPRIGGVSAIASGGQSYHAVVADAAHGAGPGRAGDRSPPSDAGWRAEPIAIVGVAAELPGAPGLGALWRRLLAGDQAFEATSDGPVAALGLTGARFAARAARYGERPADILRYDPLHFLLVDLALAAAARAELAAGSNTTVVVSAEHCSEYGLRQVAAARLPELEAQVARALAATRKDRKEVARTVRGAMARLAGDLPPLWAGSLFNLAPSFLAARIARAFDLTGPTCAVEAGGAASAIAGLEVACGRLADGAAEAAVWAAADVRLGHARALDDAPYRTRSAAPRALDAGSDGFAPGEAAAVLVLRRLADARRRGDPVYGVIRAIGSGFAPPAGALADEAALALAIRRAYAACDVAADELGFVEAFATGHRASDAAELAALASTLGAARAAALPVASVAPSVGYTGAAAGAISLVTALLALGAQTLPGTAGAHAPLTAAGLRVATAPLALAGARFAGVDAAGSGGTHYHVVVERGTHALELEP